MVVTRRQNSGPLPATTSRTNSTSGSSRSKGKGVDKTSSLKGAENSPTHVPPNGTLSKTPSAGAEVLEDVSVDEVRGVVCLFGSEISTFSPAGSTIHSSSKATTKAICPSAEAKDQIKENDQSVCYPAIPFCLGSTQNHRQKSVILIKESVYLTFLAVSFFCGLLFIHSLFVRMMCSSVPPYAARSRSIDISSSNHLSIPPSVLPWIILPLHPISNVSSHTITARCRPPSRGFAAPSMNGVYRLCRGFGGYNCVHGPMSVVWSVDMTRL